MIRPAQRDELERLTELARRSKAHWGYSADFMAACRDELTLRSEHLPHTFVHEDAGAIVGFYTWSRCGAARAELAFLFIEPAAIGSANGRPWVGAATGGSRKRRDRQLVA